MYSDFANFSNAFENVHHIQYDSNVTSNEQYNNRILDPSIPITDKKELFEDIINSTKFNPYQIGLLLFQVLVVQEKQH